jgi:Zn-dependent protease with chaperone function
MFNIVKSRRKICVNIFFNFLPILLCAQTFHPSSFVTSNIQLQQNLDAAYERELAELGKIKSSQKKIITEAYKDRKQLLTNMLSDGDFIFEGPSFECVQRVFKKLLASNPQLDQSMIVLLARTAIPNAFNTGDGFIVVNMGLLARLENESQLAFVLSHEASHQKMEHSNLAIKRYAEESTDVMAKTEQRRAISKILREEYHSTTKLANLLLPGMMSSMRHRRSSEYQADSLGLIFLKKTGYDPSHALTMLKILDEADEDLYQNNAPLSEIFNFTDYPFQNSWIEKPEEVSSLGTFAEIKYALEDSLKTHPDCLDRIKTLKDRNETLGNSYSYIDENYAPIRSNSEIELIGSYKLLGNYGRAFYQCVHLIANNHTEQYIYDELAEILAFLSSKKYDHAFGKFVSVPNTQHTDSYNEILYFLDRLSAQEALVISQKIMSKYCAEQNTAQICAARVFQAYTQRNLELCLELAESHISKYPVSPNRETFASLILRLKVKTK